MRGIEKLAALLVRNYNAPLPDKAGLFRERKETVGTYPRCGGDVMEGKKNFYCGNRAYSFAMWKEDRFFTSKKKTLSKSMAADLLKDGKAAVKGLYSEKSGKTYDAVVILADTG
jgi:DNA topoisomerase-3